MAGELVPGDHFMSHYRQRLTFWNNNLNTVSDNQLAPLANNAINEMDGLWNHRGFMNKDFYISGEGMWTETIEEDQTEDITEENILLRSYKTGHAVVARYGSILGKRGISQGFSFIDYPGMERPALSYQFRRDILFGFNGPIIDLQIIHHIQIKLGTLSLIPVQEAQAKIQNLNSRFAPTATRN
jgi:hypothetical protein